MFQKSVSVKEDLLNYMEKKYDEEFIYKEPSGGQLGSDVVEVIASTKKLENIDILIRRSTDDNGSYEYQDNYLAYLYQDQLQSLMDEISTEIYQDCRVFSPVKAMVLPKEFTAETTLNEYTSNVNSVITLYIFIEGSARSQTKDEDLEQLRLALYENQVVANGVVCYLSDEAFLSEITYDNMNDYYTSKDNYTFRGDFSMDVDYTFLYKKWR